MGVQAELKRQDENNVLQPWKLVVDPESPTGFSDPVIEPELRDRIGATTVVETTDVGAGSDGPVIAVLKRTRTHLKAIFDRLTEVKTVLTDGTQKTEITNFPPVQPVSIPEPLVVDVSDEPNRQLGIVEVSNPPNVAALAQEATLQALRTDIDDGTGSTVVGELKDIQTELTPLAKEATLADLNSKVPAGGLASQLTLLDIANLLQNEDFASQTTLQALLTRANLLATEATVALLKKAARPTELLKAECRDGEEMRIDPEGLTSTTQPSGVAGVVAYEYHGAAPRGTAVDVAEWDIVRMEINANGDLLRYTLRTGVRYDTKNSLVF